jgi:hypothetical protein
VVGPAEVDGSSKTFKFKNRQIHQINPIIEQTICVDCFFAKKAAKLAKELLQLCSTACFLTSLPFVSVTELGDICYYHAVFAAFRMVLIVRKLRIDTDERMN